MCGILGICLTHNHAIASKRTITRLLKNLFKNTEHRGRRATGVAIISPQSAKVLKGPVTASHFIETKEFQNLIDNNLKVSKIDTGPESTTFIMGHCRLDTKGTPSVNENNHPIVVRKTVGVHNGVIGNDDAVYDSFRYCANFPSRNGEVDSEIIFALIDYYQDAFSKSMVEALHKVEKELTGSFTCAAVNIKNPYLMSIFTRNSPASIIHLKKAGLVVFASEETACRRAIKDADLGEGEIIPFHPFEIMLLNVLKNEYSVHNLLKHKGGSNVTVH